MNIQKQLAEALFQFLHKNLSENNYSSYRAKDMLFLLQKKSSFETSWSMGGTSGNCYSEALSRVSAEPEGELSDLDDFLMEHFPHIGFLQYKLITRSMTRNTNYESDYYGGRVEYGVKKLSFSDLNSALIKGGLLTQAETVDFSRFIEEKVGELYPEKSSFKNHGVDSTKPVLIKPVPIKAIGIADQKKIKKPLETIKSEKPVPKSEKPLSEKTIAKKKM